MGVIVGISDRHMVMADLDNMSFKDVKSLAFLTTKRFRLKGFIILKSSPKHYHVVFDRPMRYWSSVLKVVGWMGIVGNNQNLWKWMCMQAIKGYCTLRVSPKPLNPNDVKPSPRVVYRIGSQDNKVKEYLAFRRRVLRIVKRLGVY